MAYDLETSTDDSGSPRPSVAVVGVGAIGAVVAQALTHGADVTLCRRGTTNPMSVDIGSGPDPIAARVIDTPQDAQVVDWVVLSTKAQQVDAASDWMDALVGPNTRIAVLQNGVRQADRVKRWATPERVVPAVVFTSAHRESGDLVTVRQRNHLVLPDTPAAADFATLLGSDLPVQLDADFAVTAWRKLVMNTAISSVTALTGQPVAVASAPGGRELISEVLLEGISVGRALGLALRDDELIIMGETIGSLPPTAQTSMQTDRTHHRAMEHEYLTGAVLQEASATGIDVPAIAVLHALLTASEAEGSDAARFRREELERPAA
jgi:2-dehydropantoate 2-reductase